MPDDAGRFWRRLKVLLNWRRHNAELDDEIALHLELKQRALQAQGMSPREAAAAAQRAMGNVTQLRESARGVWLASRVQSLWQDIAYGLRTIRREPVFASVAILGLSGGLGFAAAAFTGFNAFALRGWSIREPDRMVALFATSLGDPNNRRDSGFSIDQVQLFASRARSLDGVIAYDRTRPDGSGDITAAPVSAGYFSVLGVPLLRGREFAPDDDRIGAPQRVIVVSHHYWTTVLSSTPNVLGSVVKVKGVPFTVIGVASAGFEGTDLIGVDAWIPLAAMPVVQPRSDRSRTALSHSDQCCVNVSARLAEGVSREAAEQELTALMAQARRPGIDTVARTVTTQPFTVIGTAGPAVASETAPMFLLIAGGVGVVLLLACANVANLLLARAAAREREISIRLALGASRGRLVRQLMTESLILSLLAAIPALVIARVLPAWVLNILSEDAHTLRFTADTRTLCFVLALSVVSCVLFGLAPALQATRPLVIQRRRLPLRAVFLSAQVAFGLVLLVAAGLFVRSANAERSQTLGFATDDVTEVRIAIPANEDEERRAQRLAVDLPALVSSLQLSAVAFTEFEPFNPAGLNYRLSGDAEPRLARVMHATPDYFRTLSLTVVAGRAYAGGAAGAREIVVNAPLAESMGGTARAVGATLFIDSVPQTIVGVVNGAHDVGFREVHPAIYRDFSWAVAPRVIVRGDAEGARKLALALRAADPTLSVSLRSYAWYVKERASSTTFAASVAGALGLLALLLASVGMFGVFSYWVQQRQHDIGVRMALGATPANVVRIVMSASARAVGGGLAVGLVAAIAAAQVLRSSLYGLSPLDPAAYAAAIGVLVGSALLATLLPAWRAVRVSPLDALRAD